MRSYIAKTIATAGLYALTLLGGCSFLKGYDSYMHEENVPEAEGWDVDIYKEGKSLEMHVGHREGTGAMSRCRITPRMWKATAG